MKGMLDFYVTQFKIELASHFQYRFSLLVQIIVLVIEPVIYLVVWTTVAEAQGGAVGGYTTGEFAAYYIAWTLVRQMTVSLGPYEFENLIRSGGLSPWLLRPVNPFHIYLASEPSAKVFTFLWLMPILAILVIVFRPALSPTPWQLVAFAVTLVMAYLLRFVLVWTTQMAAFWITRASALIGVYFAAEFLLSGRLLPISLLPLWAQQIGNLLPFRWSFAFPLEVLLGRLTPLEVGQGFLIQGVWLLVGAVLIKILWRAGLRRYSAVGG